jgi:hypothetical protein
VQTATTVNIGLPSLRAPGPAPGQGDPPAPRAPSVRGRVIEFLAVGGLTPVLFALSWFLRSVLAFDTAEYAVGFFFFYGAYLINDPHFTVTYLLFYEDVKARAFGSAFARGQRARYVVAGFIAPFALLLWASLALATRSAERLGLLIQVMFLLVGFHYTKQGFGVMSVLSARRGIVYSARERTFLLAHGYAGWAYAWASPAVARSEAEEKGVVFWLWSRSQALERLTVILLIGSAALLLAVLIQKRIRERRLPLTTPLVAYLTSIWLWTIYADIDPLVRYATPALHSVQYLFMVHMLKRNEGREKEGPPHFAAAATTRLGLLTAGALALGFALFHGIPQTLDAILTSKRDPSSALGPTPYFAALYASVNLHHYFMDAVIWRRENPMTRYLRSDT